MINDDLDDWCDLKKNKLELLGYGKGYYKSCAAGKRVSLNNYVWV
jgi:hypothetical protein